MDERTVSKARMSLATGRCPRIRTPSSNAPRGKMAAPYSSFSSHRVRTPSSARSGPAQCRRWASADLSQGPAYISRPGLFSRQGPNRGAGLRQADRQPCRAVGVSRGRQRLRRLLSCLPALKPDFRFVLSVPLSVESPFLSRPMADSTIRFSFLSRPIHHCLYFSFLPRSPAAVPLTAESSTWRQALKSPLPFLNTQPFIRSF